MYEPVGMWDSIRIKKITFNRNMCDVTQIYVQIDFSILMESHIICTCMKKYNMCDAGAVRGSALCPFVKIIEAIIL